MSFKRTPGSFKRTPGSFLELYYTTEKSRLQAAPECARCPRADPLYLASGRDAERDLYHRPNWARLRPRSNSGSISAPETRFRPQKASPRMALGVAHWSSSWPEAIAVHP